MRYEMRLWGWALFLAVALTAAACGGSEESDGGGSSTEPCGGACPPSQCQFGECQTEGDAGDTDDGEEDAAEDTGEADAAEDAEGDADAVEDAEGDAPEDVSDADDAGDAEDDVAEDVPEEVEEGCTGDEECGEGEICNEALSPLECRAGCRQDADCEPGMFCDQDRLRCTQGCATDEDCGGEVAGMECDEEENACVPIACLRDNNCPSGFYCEEDLEQCEEGCREGTCPFGEVCDEESHECREGCREDEECDADFYCDTELLSCRSGCREDEDCSDEDECIEDEDAAPDEAGRICVPPDCRSDSQCEEGEYCGYDEGLDRDICLVGCRTSPDSCPSGYECSEEERTCQLVGCEEDSDCGEGEICDEGAEDGPSCRFGCREDGDCGDEQICLEDEQRCTCETDEHCSAEMAVCDQNVCTRGCQEDADCPEGLFCDPDFGVCLEGCRDDTYEPNDSLALAGPIPPGEYQLRMCYPGPPPEDAQDCFRIDIEQVGALTIAATFSHERGDLNLVLLNPAFEEVATSNSITDDESIEYAVEEAGPFRFCVTPAGDEAFRLSYGLSISLETDE